MPRESGRRRPPPAAAPAAPAAPPPEAPPAAPGATANRPPAPAPPRQGPAPSAAAIRATGTGRAGIPLAPPRLTPLSHRHIHQRSCESAVTNLVIRRRQTPPT